ncbi:hypothetical protein, partial [Mesorhizobium sp. M7A.F.Ca.CA.001.07.2.1]|uniref:hypothetical protein n=1 Tax=Mesorhizobium sp. M7A.F.Ca.CA.001.07.2.1 TaxID=2496684 RepID=UPI0019D4D6E7
LKRRGQQLKTPFGKGGIVIGDVPGRGIVGHDAFLPVCDFRSWKPAFKRGRDWRHVRVGALV